ncbi:response regulator transcription factor [Bacillus sp. SM2101]|uniref:response regulator transcription factor n=1 Tax=Bacillus sp. SM2101 TaxID=2805366 RepID=UPI001BDEFC60
MENSRVLIVDDEKSIVKMLEMVLMKEGFNLIFKAHSINETMVILEQEQIDYIVLDVMLPDQSGFEALPKIKTMTNAHILFLTARTSDLDVLTGFAIGGDDYVTKPFNPLEIVARIKAANRRSGNQLTTSSSERENLYDFGFFILDEITKELNVNGEVVSCPPQIYRLLQFLCENPNRVFSKEELFEKVWGLDTMIDDNTVMVHIRRLRERIEPDPSNPRFLVTVRGLGYKLMKEQKK